MKVNKKLFVFSLIWFLLFLSFAVLVKPINADPNPTPITLPYTISQPGNYQIASSWTGTGTALTIDASNVVVDGQNYLLTGDGLNTGVISISSSSSNVTLENINEKGGYVGLYAEQVTNFTVQNSNLNNNVYIGLDAYLASKFVVQYCNLNNNEYYGLKAESASNCTIRYSNMNNNYYFGLATYGADKFIVTGDSFVGNGFGNGLSSRSPDYGGAAIEDSNCTVTNNIFNSNNDGILWQVLPVDNTVNNVEVYTNNVFENNQYTFHFDYQLPSSNTNQKFFFYNNLVNDSGYVDPDSYTSSNSGPYLPFNSAVLNLNTTLQAGIRIYSKGSMIGGNFWANPDGTGYSQTGTDTKHDGFVDAPFNLFQGTAYSGTIYDYLPYSTSDSVSLIYTAGAGQSLAANQMSSMISVQPRDYFGSLTSGLTFNLATTSSTGKFYSNQAGTNQISSVTIPSGSSLGSFYYKDSAAGAPTITVSSQGVTSAATEFTIASHASTVASVTITPPGSSISAGATETYSATASDAYGNSWDVTSSTTWGISSGAGGSWSGNVYTSANAGSWTVTGTYDTVPYTTGLTVNHAGLNHFVFNAVASQTAGSAFSITVTAKDAYGNTVTSYSGMPTLRVSIGTISPTSTSAFSSGVWTGMVTVTAAGSGVTITATDGTSAGTSNSFTVTHAAAVANVVLSPAGSSVTAGATETYSATASDAYGNSWDVTSSTTWGISSGAGGSWSGNVYTSHTVGSWTVTAIVSGVTGTAPLSVTAGALATVSVSGPTSVTAGGTVAFTATGYDAQGNSLGVQTVSWSITGGAAGSWSGNVYTSANAGSWTVTGTYDSVPYTTDLTVNPGALDHFLVTVPASATAGTSFAVTITAKDALGNTVTSYAGSVSLSASQGSISPSASGSFTGGIWTGSVTLSSAATSVTITTSDNNDHSGTSSGITVTASSPSPTPTPTPISTPAPTATPTPVPTPTITPAPTLTPTLTPTPTSSSNSSLSLTTPIIIVIIVIVIIAAIAGIAVYSKRQAK